MDAIREIKSFLPAGCDDFIPMPVSVSALENKLNEYEIVFKAH